MVTFTSAVTAVVSIANEVVVAPAGTVTVDGTVALL